MPKLPVAIVLEPGQRSLRRQRADLDGWQAAIADRRYDAQVRYKTGTALVTRLRRLTTQVGLDASQFVAGEDITASAVVVPAAVAANNTAAPARLETQPDPTCRPPPSIVDRDPHPPPRPMGDEETPERAAERQRLLDELHGVTEHQPRRLWRRRLA